MSLRTSRLVLACALAGCTDALPDEPEGEAGTEIACAPAGAVFLSERCRLVRSGDLLVVTRPDGGFRRLRLLPDSGLEAADGAEPLRILATGPSESEVAIGEDRYRLPVARGQSQ